MHYLKLKQPSSILDMYLKHYKWLSVINLTATTFQPDERLECIGHSSESTKPPRKYTIHNDNRDLSLYFSVRRSDLISDIAGISHDELGSNTDSKSIFINRGHSKSNWTCDEYSFDCKLSDTYFNHVWLLNGSISTKATGSVFWTVVEYDNLQHIWDHSRCHPYRRL